MIIPLEKIIKDYNLKIRGVIHIGAHHGQEYQDYVNAGIEEMIFFEPVMSNFKRLLDTVPRTSNVRVYNLALGSEVGKMDMYIETANQGQSCSLLEPGTHLDMYPHIKFPTKETVNVERLDNIPLDIHLYNMINIDIQGFELEAFKGATMTLEYIDYVYAEVNTEEVYKGCALVGEIDAFLSEYGFERVLTCFPKRTPQECYPWGDALYIKK